MSCLQYYYPDPVDAEKYRIKCKSKVYEGLNNIETFNNKDLLSFVDTNFSTEAFKDQGAELGPFEFSPDYKDQTNQSICNSTTQPLAPQQKFLGQIINPNTNFNGALVYHGLGSGKTCTSIVIGEAFKTTTKGRLLYVVPAPLVDQYYNEIVGEIRNGKYWSCTSFCIVEKNGGVETGDFYATEASNKLLIAKATQLKTSQSKLDTLQDSIDSGDDSIEITAKFKALQNEISKMKIKYIQFQKDLRSKALKTFDIISHQKFIESLYKTGANGQLIKKSRLLEDGPVFHKDGILVIDEIQRLISSGGIFYKKLYNAIKYYFHPELRVVLLSATPIYDNPYELAQTINLLRPRIPFPINKNDFYKFFVGEYNEETGECTETKKSWISRDSCIMNSELFSYLCAGYVSYFKGGNPNAYPYKRVITLEHVMAGQQKSEYILALESDITKDKNFKQKSESSFYEDVIIGNYDTLTEDSVSGIYVTTQQNSNISLPRIGSGLSTSLIEKKRSLGILRSELAAQKFKKPMDVVDYLKLKGISNKFASIVEHTINSNGPVFIFSNWLIYGVEPLAIILEACGFAEFNNPGENRFFVWSSETKTKDKNGEERIRAAKAMYNSPENADGSLLKVILGTRSVMEGVSFKNVRQVHLTEPWWNESRIEQITARGSRYCSHSGLPLPEQTIDVFRHYSVLPVSGEPDPDVVSMLNKYNRSSFQNYELFGIDQKMTISSIQKAAINIGFSNILKSVAIDARLNKDGNVIRLEEHLTPLPNGKMQVYFRNPSNSVNYIREGIPLEGISLNDVHSRKYSFPNDTELPLVFTEAGASEFDYFTPFDDAEIIKEPTINSSLIIPEIIVPWDSAKTFKDIETTPEIKIYFENLGKNYSLIPQIRKEHFKETGDDVIKFGIDDPRIRTKLISCIKKLATNNIVGSIIKKKIVNEFNEDKRKTAMNDKIIDIIFTYKLYPEQYFEELQELAISNPDAINEILKEAEKIHKKSTKAAR